MKTLVTGATGLVGSWVCRKLMARGDEVRVLVRDAKRLPVDLSGRVELVLGDVTAPATLTPAMRDVEVVFHAAGLPEQHVKDESVFERVNHQGTVNVLEAAHSARVRRVVYTSTMDVFDAPKGGVVTEASPDDAPRPTEYERSKQRAQHSARTFAEQLDVVWVNPGAIYGPGLPTMLTGTIAKLLNGELPALPPGGMSVVYVEGLADAHLAAASRGVRGQGYLVADAHVTPIELAQAVAAEVPGLRVPPTAPAWALMAVAKLTTPVFSLFGREPLADAGQLTWLLHDTHVDASRARHELGFVPTSLAEGVRRTVRALRQQVSVAMMFALFSTVAVAAEGKWTPQQVQQHGAAWVKQQGFELPLSSLWEEKRQSGLLANAVQLPGCSGSFVSADGLLITNHHCVVSILQEHSTPAANLVKQGYLARTRADEKASKSFRIQVPRAFRDVTAEVLAAIPANSDDLGRYRAVESAQKALVAKCEQQPGTRCTFATFDGGLFFTLTEFSDLSDVRIVYAPPTAIADFGGEVDNWTWPRHTGDFALVRVYVDGKPYKPTVWFPVSQAGVKPGDAVAVLGYPGSSLRAALSEEMREREERWYPRLRDLSTEWIHVMEDESKRSPEVGVAVADDLRGLLNVRKNAQGQLAGFARGNIVEKQRGAEERVKTFATKQKDALEAFEGLHALAQQRLATWDHDFVLDVSTRGAKALSWSLAIVRRSVEAQRPDVEREPGWQERDLPRLRERLERDQKRYAPAVDQRLFESWLDHARALTAPLSSLAEVTSTNKLYTSKVLDLATRQAMLDETPEQLKARRDPLLDFAWSLDAERRALRDRRDAYSGRALELRPRWRRVVIAEAGHPIAPDANSSLRVTFGRVKGYAPRDAVSLGAQTTLSGVLEKAGNEPFELPMQVREAAQKKTKRWFDARLNDVPVDFLSDCDTTGGNSGSPTIDARGRLVGVNFDRVWENVANDFGYNPDVARNVNADVRYLLWLLDEVEHATGLLQELGVRD